MVNLDGVWYCFIIAGYALALTIIIIKCTVSLMFKGQTRRTVDFGTTRRCTAQDLDLLGGVLSEHPSKECAEWVCTICLSGSHSDVEVPQELRELKLCKHIFHRECIDRWCLDAPMFSLRCPVCRGSIFADQIDPSLDSEPVGRSTSMDEAMDSIGLPGG